jgi:hypothetical protein
MDFTQLLRGHRCELLGGKSAAGKLPPSVCVLEKLPSASSV